MHLKAYGLKNFRRFINTHIELSSDISIYVGANNSGKTSATQAVQMFLSGNKARFSLFDFSSHIWHELNQLGDSDPAQDVQSHLPAISLDLWFYVEESDLSLVLPILPNRDWSNTEAGIRIEFGAIDSFNLLQRYRNKRAAAQQQLELLGEAAGSYNPWPRNLTDFLEKELKNEFALTYLTLDRAQFDDSYNQHAGYIPEPVNSDQGGAQFLRSLIRIDCLNAQRHLSDSDILGSSGARAEDLSRRLSKFYQRNLDQRPDDHSTLKALFESEESLNRHLQEVFKPTLERIAKLGYPGLHNPRLEISSDLNPATVMSQDAKIEYVLGENNPIRLPDSYNGLGFKNLIYMVVELLDVQEKWKLEEPRPPLHLVFIEEPEAHLHAQLQQAFIRNVLELIEIPGEEQNIFNCQLVITTHSPHILYERGFEPIRYFRRHVINDTQTTQVVNLSTFQPGANPKDRDFLQRYLKLTHCDLFFADAVILVEGNVERLLLPLMIEKEAKTLRSASLSILEVGGAFGHRFKELIYLLGITTLIITDIDSVELVAQPNEDPDQEEETEFEVPNEIAGQDPVKKYGKTCEPSVPGAATANQTLIKWLPKKKTIAELHATGEAEKIEAIAGTDHAKVRVAYQKPTLVTWQGVQRSLCGRTLEVSFGLQNPDWCQHMDRKSIGLKLRGEINSPENLATGLHKRVIAQHFDKTNFALGVLARKAEQWVVPEYISEGLHWLEKTIDLEEIEDIQAAVEAIEGAVLAPGNTGE